MPPANLSYLTRKQDNRPVANKDKLRCRSWRKKSLLVLCAGPKIGPAQPSPATAAATDEGTRSLGNDEKLTRPRAYRSCCHGNRSQISSRVASTTSSSSSQQAAILHFIRQIRIRWVKYDERFTSEVAFAVGVCKWEEREFDKELFWLMKKEFRAKLHQLKIQIRFLYFSWKKILY